MAMRKSKKPAAAFVVVGIRKFVNGEHHWMAPLAEHSPYRDPKLYGSTGLDVYGKPVFESLKDAEAWVTSFMMDEWHLEPFERSRPKFAIVEESTLAEVMERDSYPYPDEAEKWSDAKAADFERRVDCEFLLEDALWDSDSDEESDLARELGYVAEFEKAARRRRKRGASK